MKIKSGILISLLAVIVTCMPIYADSVSLPAQRAIFLRARSALEHGNSMEFRLLALELHDYPLYPYLIYDDLKQRLPHASIAEIHAFLQQYADTPLAPRLREQWLMLLAAQHNWPLYLKNYQATDNAELACYHLQALIATGHQQTAFQLIPALWLVGNTQPAACEAPFAAWRQAGYMTPDVIWQRVGLAIAARNSFLLKQLQVFLPEEQKSQVVLWQKVHTNPKLILQTRLFMPINNAHIRDIVNDGMLRYIALSPVQASHLLSIWQHVFALNQDEQQILIRAVAINLAADNNPSAYVWLMAVSPSLVDQHVQEWRIRTALAQNNWQSVYRNIENLPADQKARFIWRYWLARAQMQLGQSQAAQATYHYLANQVDYYGLLASQQLHQSYQPSAQALLISNQTMHAVESMPAMQRAHELYVLQMIVDARREWLFATNQMSKPELCAAAKWVTAWGWYDRAILTAAKAGDRNNIAVRFPLAYEAIVLASAKEWELSPAWILAIMRQESSFMSDARSDMGALGLMQLMPQTAKLLGHIQFNDYSVLNATTNIYLGSHYLKQLADWYHGNLVSATAAYNLGPTRLAKWLPLQETLPIDIWVEILPWQETRDYVKAVMLNKAIYQLRLQG
jgi:soluble lytic murein transglycosylase